MGVLNQTASLEIRGQLAKRRLTRNDVANALGLSLRTISDLLGERRPWRVDEIEVVAQWLGISASELLFPKQGGHAYRAPRGRRSKQRAAPSSTADDFFNAGKTNSADEGEEAEAVGE